MKSMRELVDTHPIENRILLIRGLRVMIDTDLARVYGVSTKVLNQAVKRNGERFPKDFMFQLTLSEKKEVVTNCDHLDSLKYSSQLPFVFTEHGATMLASVLNSEKAIEASVQVVRAFVKLREIISSNRMLAKKLDQLEKKYDHQFKVVFEAIRQLMEPAPDKAKKIGFL